jgi:hypothetical protein
MGSFPGFVGAVSKADFVGSVSKMCDGLAKILGKAGTVLASGKEVKLRDVVAARDELVAKIEATEAAKAAYARAVADEHAADAWLRPLLLSVRAHLVGSYSKEQLAICGLSPRKEPRALSSEERSVATAKNRATRVAHGRKPAKVAREEAARAALAAIYAPPPNGDAPAATTNGTSAPQQAATPVTPAAQANGVAH